VQMMALFYEKKVGTMGGLKKEVSRLDSDAGIRIVGQYMNRPCFAFVTRFITHFTVMVYARKVQNASVGRIVLAKEFESPEQLEVFLRKIIRGKVEAYVY